MVEIEGFPKGYPEFEDFEIWENDIDCCAEKNLCIFCHDPKRGLLVIEKHHSEGDIGICRGCLGKLIRYGDKTLNLAKSPLGHIFVTMNSPQRQRNTKTKD